MWILFSFCKIWSVTSFFKCDYYLLFEKIDQSCVNISMSDNTTPFKALRVWITIFPCRDYWERGIARGIDRALLQTIILVGRIFHLTGAPSLSVPTKFHENLASFFWHSLRAWLNKWRDSTQGSTLAPDRDAVLLDNLSLTFFFDN